MVASWFRRSSGANHLRTVPGKVYAKVEETEQARMEIAYSKACGLKDGNGGTICAGRKLATWYKLLIGIFGCLATIYYYTARSPVIFPSQSWVQMGIDPGVIALISPLIPIAIIAVVFLMSLAIVLADNYEHAYGVFFAAIGVPAVIFTILKAVV